MYCNKCGNYLKDNQKFCNKCGNLITYNNKYPHNKITKYLIFLGFLILFISIILLFNYIRNDYYFSNNAFDDTNDTSRTNNSSYETVIIADHKYSGTSVFTALAAKELIEKDSVEQKVNCPQNIKAIENEIISKYGISAVNLCEINIDFAKEIENVFNKVYNDFPGIRDILTNLTIVNATIKDDYIAAFSPVFFFATSNSSSTYPWVIKTQILLNSKYFLNQEKLKVAVTSSSEAGHFPPNATIYSPVAHELGHYLSYIALMKHYSVKESLLMDNSNISELYSIYSDFEKGVFSQSIIKEAFLNYNKTHSDYSNIDEWRGTISKYALAKDNDGNYIYDETIAEAFHDIYLNGNSAKEASKYIIDVLKEKLK